MTAKLPDGLREALGQVIANERREWRRERELIEAQSRETIAELRARIVEFERTIEQKVSDRLASLKDGSPGASVTVDDLEPVVADLVQRAVSAIRIPENGKDADPELIASLVSAAVEERVAEAVAAIPPAQPGRDADPETIAGLVAEEVAKLPPAERGKDADPEVIRSMVAEAVALLPPAEKGADADPAVIEIMVSEAVAKLPHPAAGKDADPELVRSMVAEAVAALPDPKPGERGPEGAPGKMPLVREWEDRVYYESEAVTLDGSTFQALRDTGRSPPHEDWNCIAAAGRNGVDGRSLKIAATFDPEKTDYRELDVVALNGGSFAARKDNPGPCPGAGWQLVASQGKQGKPGDRGIQGMKGERGEDGPPVVAIQMDDQGLLRLTNADGSVVDADLYPVLSRIG